MVDIVAPRGDNGNMIPMLPLDALAGYTITREGPHFYTLTPIERTATMDRDCDWTDDQPGRGEDGEGDRDWKLDR